MWQCEKGEVRATSVSTVKSPASRKEPSPQEVKAEEDVQIVHTSGEADRGTKGEPIPVLDSVLTYPPGVTLEVVE